MFAVKHQNGNRIIHFAAFALIIILYGYVFCDPIDNYTETT